MIFFDVNGTYLNNIFLALHHAWKTGAEVKLYCYDHEFDQYDWTQEPNATLDQLMTDHAFYLRNKYERLVLLWSGGTDSHTIYQIFAKNRIHIDEIIVKEEPVENSIYPPWHGDWLLMNHWDPTTIITRYDEHDSFLRGIDVTDQDWVWKNKGDLLKYGMSVSADGVRFLCERNHAGHSWKAIGGYEKPRLVYRQGQWYHRQLAQPLQPTMGHDYVDHFFLEPLIAIKQAHMVKQEVKKQLTKTSQYLYDGDWAETKWPNTAQGYREWACACGRHDELTLGISHHQKIHNIELISNEIVTEGNWKQLAPGSVDAKLIHDLRNNNQLAINYIQGFHNIKSEHGFMTWLTDTGWLKQSDRCFTQIKHIWSKERSVGS
jgi:hypothetical protein